MIRYYDYLLMSPIMIVNSIGCFWCGNFVGNSFGLCKSLYYPNFQGQCFVEGIFVQTTFPPICGYVGCTPPAQPYNSSSLNLSYLTTVGYPPVDPSLHTSLATQISFAEVRILNDTMQFCNVDRELQEWCGVGLEFTPNAFQYIYLFSYS